MRTGRGRHTFDTLYKTGGACHFLTSCENNETAKGFGVQPRRMDDEENVTRLPSFDKNRAWRSRSIDSQATGVLAPVPTLIGDRDSEVLFYPEASAS